jgi:membrane-bound inhibitor of C-type lysozyme
MRAGLAALPALGLLGQPAPAETLVQTLRYTCDRGVEIPVTQVTAPDQAVMVLHVDGSQITLFQEPAASGVRYGWPSDGSSYVWWTKGDAATLFWKTPEGETPLLTCREN